MNIGCLVKHTVRRAVAGLCPYSVLRTIVNHDLLVPYYHMVSDADLPHVKHLYAYKSIGAFVADLDFLLRHYAPISLADVIEVTKNRGSLPTRSFHLTFDDGFREMADVVAPILLQKGIPATFFINTAFIDNRELCYLHKASILEEYLRTTSVSSTAARQRGAICQSPRQLSSSFDVSSPLEVDYKNREILGQIARGVGYDFKDYLDSTKPYLTTKQIRRLLDLGFTIGAHSVDHPRYQFLPLEEQLRQTLDSLVDIRTRFGLSYGTFAFPHTDYGVSKEFFIQIYQSGLVDVTFGTGGMVEDMLPQNRQRVSLEKPLWPARNVLRYHLARKLYKQAIGGRLVCRH
jgi:peptidoglycan/xylan/chitin deacetylase (PgdA/CDA1 family)